MQEDKSRSGLAWFLSLLRSRFLLLIAFMMTVMGDPVSSVAYAIQAALGALGGDLGLLLQTMGLVVAVVAVVVVNYLQIVARFPEGGGAAAATGRAFGEGWAFVPIGSLIVDYTLTISISISAGASAIVAYLPALAPVRTALALGLLLLVAGVSWFGYLARVAFGAMTIAFVAVSVLVLLGSVGAQPTSASAAHHTTSTHSAFVAILLAFPVAMALATGIEAPSSAIAQLGQLDDEGRKHFGRLTLLAILLIVGALSLGFTAAAVRLGIGLPGSQDTTMIAEIGRASVGNLLFAAFQAITSMLLLAAAASSLQAGPGLMEALARHQTETGERFAILPEWLGRTNRYYTPYWGVAVFGVLTAAIVLLTRASEQEIVLFYAVAVFVSFLCGLLAVAMFSYREGKRRSFAINITGALIVFFVLVVNVVRGLPLISLSASLMIALCLYLLWVKSGRPRGVSKTVARERSARA